MRNILFLQLLLTIVALQEIALLMHVRIHRGDVIWIGQDLYKLQSILKIIFRQQIVLIILMEEASASF